MAGAMAVTACGFAGTALAAENKEIQMLRWRTSGGEARRLQTGQVQTYGLWYVAGVLVLLLVLWAKLR